MEGLPIRLHKSLREVTVIVSLEVDAADNNEIATAEVARQASRAAGDHEPPGGVAGVGHHPVDHAALESRI